MNNKRYQHILFDLDGTLTDPMIGITSSVKYALSYFNIEVEDLRSLCPFIGPPLKTSFKDFYQFTDEQADVAIAKYREYFSKQGIFENTLYQGIDELLRLLTENEMKIYLATSKPQPFAQQNHKKCITEIQIHTSTACHKNHAHHRGDVEAFE